MKKNIKKFNPADKKALSILIEEVLERDKKQLKGSIKKKNAEGFYKQIERLLSNNQHFMDEVDYGDINEEDYRKGLKRVHTLLQPIWNQVKTSLLDFNNIEAQREGHRLLQKNKHKLDPIISEYKDLLTAADISSETIYKINIETLISFDTGHILHYQRSINLIYNFLELLSRMDISLIRKCEYSECDKYFFLTRSDRKFCKGCAQKEYQRKQWKDNNEKMKDKENKRYHDKRKKK